MIINAQITKQMEHKIKPDVLKPFFIFFLEVSAKANPTIEVGRDNKLKPIIYPINSDVL